MSRNTDLTCPRCDTADVRVLTRSPVPGAWEMYSCRVCLYSWRSTEPDSARNPATYPAAFKLDPAEIDALPVVPALPD